MTGQTVTRADLCEAVYQEVGLSRNESADLVETVLNEIADALVRGDMVKISSFGSFTVRQKGERIGRSVPLGRSGEPAHVAQAVTFLAANDFITGAVIHVDGGEHLLGPVNH